MWNDFKSVAHIYPFVDTGIVFIKQTNFDWDNDGKILVVSRYKQGLKCRFQMKMTGKVSNIPIEPAEVNSSLDFQFHKRQGDLVKNNNVVVTLENQRGDAFKFFSSPIGGVPVYQPIITLKKRQKISENIDEDFFQKYRSGTLVCLLLFSQISIGQTYSFRNYGAENNIPSGLFILLIRIITDSCG